MTLLPDKSLLDEVIHQKATDDSGRCGYAQFEPDNTDSVLTPDEALEGINKIRNSIVGLQNLNWSEHIYPLVSLLNRAGYIGLPYPEAKANFGTCLDQRNEAIELIKELTKHSGSHTEQYMKVQAFLKRCGAND